MTDTLKYELTKMIQDVSRGLEQRTSTAIKSAMQRNEDFFFKACIKANQREIDEGQELDNKQLTKQILEAKNDIIDLKRRSNPYVLSEQFRNLGQQFEDLKQELNFIKKTLSKINSDKMLDTTITPKELKGLYAQSGCSHDEMARYLNVDKSRFYQILNGDEKTVDWVRINKLKSYFLKKIHDASTRS